MKELLKRLYRLIFGKVYADLESKMQYLEDKILILQSGLWDESYYIKESGWGRRGDDTPLDHYMREGWKKGFNPSEKFDGKTYSQKRPDLPVNPLAHYLRYGRYPLANIYKPSEKTISDYWEVKQNRQSKKVVYTCITNKYDDLSEIACFHYTDFSWDYVCYTDDVELIEQKRYGIWEIRPLVFTDLDVIRNARRHKVLAHKLFPEYDESIYIDANVNIVTPWLFEEISRRNTDLLIPLHFNLKCLYDEYQHVSGYQIIDEQTGKAQIDKYHNEVFPANYGLNETNIVYRRHNSPEIIKLMEDWANEIIHFTQRDQLSLSYVMWKNHRKIADFAFPNIRWDSQNFCVFTHGKWR